MTLRTTIRAFAALALAFGAAPPAHAQSAQDEQPNRRVRLEADTVVDGIHCAPTGRHSAEFFRPSGRLAECPLAGDAVVAGHALPAGTWVVLDADGRLAQAWLSRDATIDGRLCKGTGYKEWSTAFHPSGRLRSCFLPEEATIDGVLCRAGTFWGEVTGGVTVSFHENGRLASCGAARAIEIGGVRFRARERVRLGPDGHALAR